jgi:hypothetical protein
LVNIGELQEKKKKNIKKNIKKMVKFTNVHQCSPNVHQIET